MKLTAFSTLYGKEYQHFTKTTKQEGKGKQFLSLLINDKGKQMKKYKVKCHVECSLLLDVDAKTKDDAFEIAAQQLKALKGKEIAKDCTVVNSYPSMVLN